MHRLHPTPALGLSPRERRRLSYMSRMVETASSRGLKADELAVVALRARIILAIDRATDLRDVARSMQVALATVQKWCARFMERRLDGLLEHRHQRGGRRLSPATLSKILSAGAGQGGGRSSRQIAKIAGVSQSSVSRFLRAQTALSSNVTAEDIPAVAGAYVL